MLGLEAMEKTRNRNKRVCSECGSDKTYITRRGFEQWNFYENRRLCYKCWSRLVRGPKWNHITNKKWGPINDKKRIEFKDRTIRLKENPKKYQCSKCLKSIGDEYIDYK